MKPFNLERALAGDAVVTRLGVEVSDLSCLKVKMKRTVSGRFLQPTYHAWTEKGESGTSSDFDLFMKD